MGQAPGGCGPEGGSPNDADDQVPPPLTGARMTAGAAPALLLVACASCATGVPPRYAASSDVRASAQRAVIVGMVSCEDLWMRRALEGVVVRLMGEVEGTPMAMATSGRDGAFALVSGFVPTPDQPGHLRISGRGWSDRAPLVGALDQTYSVVVTVLCPAGRPEGAAMLDAVVSLQPPPTPELPPYPMVGGHHPYWDIHRQH
jgi:hypothetical protein